MSSYIITGATGWLGRAILENIFIAQGHIENVICVASSRREENLGFTTINTLTFQEIPNITGATVFHLAYLTKDKNSFMTDAEYIEKNHQIRNAVVKILKMGQKNFFYASSGAVYHMNGYSLYGDLKLQDEELFKDICQKEEIKFLNTRIFNLMGRHIQNYKVYAIADFITQCLEKNAIQISSKSHVIRSYIDIKNLIQIIFAFFEDKKSEQFYSFNTAHATLNLFELANIIAKLFGNESTTIIHNIDTTLAPNSYIGNQSNQSTLIERYNITLQSIEESILEMKEYLVRI